MVILGLNAYHADSAACILVDGKLIAAAEEERFTRIKHWAGLPALSVQYCLDVAGLGLREVNHIAVNRNPNSNMNKKMRFILSNRTSFDLISDRLKNMLKIKDIKSALFSACNIQDACNHIVLHHVEHHPAHLGSAFYVSPFDQAVALSIDGFGDFIGAMWGVAHGKTIEIKHRTFFPHSIGLFYLAITQYLGFMDYGDEFKVMGLAAYGEPEYLNQMRTIVKTFDRNNEWLFELDLEYFRHTVKGASMTWENGEPKIGPVFSDKLLKLFGPVRKKGESIEKRHKNIAASLQKRYEEVFFHILNRVFEKTKYDNLVLAGGCAMNSLANGKIFQHTPFKKVFIQPAAGDAGGAIGAAYTVLHQVLGIDRSFVLENAYLGPEYSNDQIRQVLNCGKLNEKKCLIKKAESTESLCRQTAQAISEGKVVGWFQGRMEWGPRALGNRSIVCDPRRTDMKDILNVKIKRRESFRPFAPSVHLEAAHEYFDSGRPEPFMLKVQKIKPEKQQEIPAVVHIDGTGRLQTVKKQDNPLYWQLIESFRKITGVPVLLNTSFNESEPIVCKPEEALDCFLRTRMDALVMGDWIIERKT